MEGFNPCRPHSLRAAFKSKLVNKNSDDLIEFWMGHALGSTKDAYLNMPTEELRELYMDAEKHLAIEKTSRDELAELEKKLPTEVNKQIMELRTQLNELQKTLEQKVEQIARHVFVELRGTIEDTKEARAEFVRRYKKELKEPSPKPKEEVEEISKIAQEETEQPKKKEESKQKPKKEPSWHELIYGTKQEDTNA